LFLPTALAASDLSIEVTKPATCHRPTRAGDSIAVHYRGTLLSDGSVFDTSYKRGQPFDFVLGRGMVIKGWDQGLLDMCVGEARKLTIPPSLGYGDRDMGVIPPGSTLVFETELISIAGVAKEEVEEVETMSTSTMPAVQETGAVGAGNATMLDHGDRPPPPDKHEGDKGPHEGKPEDGNSGECSLLGPFALIIQGALGGLALSSLVWKRYRETPRRPLKVWWFDVSKQVVGSILLHVANLFMSMLSSGNFDMAVKVTEGAAKAAFIQDDRQPNPCSFYLLNLAIDTTIGIPILVILLRLLHFAFSHTALANPPESIKSGHYGRPPRASWWLKQSLIYFLGLFGMKLCVFAIFQLLPWLAWVGDWALRWTEGNEALQIIFVMLVFPVIMNAIQYYIIDGFIKDPEGASEGGAAQSHGNGADDEHAEERRPLRADEAEDEYASGREDGDDEARAKKTARVKVGKTGTEEALKEVNPTPIPDYDPEVDGEVRSDG
ncbi:hypothetical protein K490DRAFT_18081, partial [Saccharata proteae CBS 121410]